MYLQTKMKNQITISLALAILGWVTVIAQYLLMIENRVASIPETTIRFFSFFTILTNSLVALYLTIQGLGKREGLFNKPGTLTAITIYITIVCLIYQAILRHIWEPKGFQMLVDEMLHTIIPILVIGYWLLFEDKSTFRIKQILPWMNYPLAYLVFVLIRGSFSGFYPYPFINVDQLGFNQVMTNSVMILCLFLVVSIIFIAVGRMISRTRKTS